MAILNVLVIACLASTALAEKSPAEIYGYANADVLDTVDVTGDGGVVKLVLKRGDGPTPRAGQKVNAHYDGRLTDGAVFDSSRTRGQPFSFNVGQGRVIKGWDVGFAGMSVGEKSILVIKSDYGYGARGAGGKIPGGATLLFEVELLSVA